MIIYLYRTEFSFESSVVWSNVAVENKLLSNYIVKCDLGNSSCASDFTGYLYQHTLEFLTKVC